MLVVYVVLHIFTQFILLNINYIIPIECNNFNGIKPNTNVNRASYLLKDPEYPYFTYLPNTHNNYDKPWYPGQLFLKTPTEEGNNNDTDNHENTNNNETNESTDVSHKTDENNIKDNDLKTTTNDSIVNDKDKPNVEDTNDIHTQSINPAKGITINNNIQSKRKHEDLFDDVKQAIYSLYERAKDKGIEIDKKVELNTTEDLFKALDNLSKLIESYTYNLKSLDSGINQQFDNNSESLDNTVPDTSGQFLQLSKSKSDQQSVPHSVDELRSFLDEFMETLNEVISKNTGIVDLLGHLHPHVRNTA